jgi:hypothetical protein
LHVPGDLALQSKEVSSVPVPQQAFLDSKNPVTQVEKSVLVLFPVGERVSNQARQFKKLMFENSKSHEILHSRT